LTDLPETVQGIIQGVLPPVLLSLLLMLLPYVLRFLAQLTGVSTGMTVELAVQDYYFAFLFVQLFLVVTLSSGITKVISQVGSNPAGIPSLLATNLPSASNYFFSYILIQGLSTSAGALLQVTSLAFWFLWGPIFDSTARDKWARQVNLQTMQWGTFFPVYTTYATIGLIYSVISPLILVFVIIPFALFWVVYRYNSLYVTRFRFDTGGLLFPKAINQLFVGLYFMELCLVGLFFLVKTADADGNVTSEVPCKAQAVVMIVVLILTAIFQLLLNLAFGPLFRYLPVTLEDEAVVRDEEFARAQEEKWRLADGDSAEGEASDDDHATKTEDPAPQMPRGDAEAGGEQPAHANNARRAPGRLDAVTINLKNLARRPGTWADRSRARRASNVNARDGNQSDFGGGDALDQVRGVHRRHHRSPLPGDGEAQMGMTAISDALFGGIHDELQDLTPDERDKLVRRAFKHSALRARRPVIWIPQDELGVSDDECLRTTRFTKYIWISNQHAALDSKARVVYKKSPPDFDEVDLIEL
jgi:calcium permeable stress-gated cation channel